MPLWRRGARWLPATTWFLLMLVLSADGPGGSETVIGPDRGDPTLPENPDRQPLGYVSIWGHGAGLPAAFPSKQVVSVYLDRATIQPGLTEVRLPLEDLRLRSAARRGVPWTTRKAVDAIWELHVTGTNAELTIRGPWVLLAQIGTLARWPQPS